jgi:hypothetical protein
MHLSSGYMQYYAAPQIADLLSFLLWVCLIYLYCSMDQSGMRFLLNVPFLFTWLHVNALADYDSSCSPCSCSKILLLSEMFSKDPKPQIRGQGYPGSLSFWNFPGAKHEDRCNNGNNAACFGSGCCLSLQSSLRSSCRQGPGQFEGKASG